MEEYSHSTICFGLTSFSSFFPCFLSDSFLSLSLSDPFVHSMALLGLTDHWPSKVQWFGIRRSNFPLYLPFKEACCNFPSRSESDQVYWHVCTGIRMTGPGAREEEEGTFEGLRANLTYHPGEGNENLRSKAILPWIIILCHEAGARNKFFLLICIY